MTRPYTSGVAVTLPRATDMLAVADQVPVELIADALEPEPAANAGTASASTAHVTEPTDLALMEAHLPSRRTTKTIGGKSCASLTRPLTIARLPCPSLSYPVSSVPVF